MDKAQEEAQQVLADAQARLQEAGGEAQRIKAAAEAEANQIRMQVQEAARRMDSEARANASQIIAAAEQQRRDLVSRESVLQTARAEADMLSRQTRQELDELHDQVYDFLGGLMKEIDRYLFSTIDSLHAEYKELESHRQGRLSDQE